MDSMTRYGGRIIAECLLGELVQIGALPEPLVIYSKKCFDSLAGGDPVLLYLPSPDERQCLPLDLKGLVPVLTTCEFNAAVHSQFVPEFERVTGAKPDTCAILYHIAQVGFHSGPIVDPLEVNEYVDEDDFTLAQAQYHNPVYWFQDTEGEWHRTDELYSNHDDSYPDIDYD